MSTPRTVVVAGTGTEVGKTWVACRLILALRELGVAAVAWKPAQSFAVGSGPTDADLLAQASGQRPEEVCPRHRWYEVPMAPPMAASALGREPFGLRDLLSELRWPAGTELGVVETAGGVRSPLAADGDTLDLVGALDPYRVVLVADAGLGTINSVRLSCDVLEGTRARGRVLVLLNRFDASEDLHRRNRDWLASQARLDVMVSVASLATLLADAREGDGE